MYQIIPGLLTNAAGMSPANNSILLDFVNDSYIHTNTTYSGFDNYLAGTGSTFGRALAAHYVDASGNMTLVSTGTLRRGTKGALIEPAATNLILTSTANSQVNTTVTLAQSGDPVGGSNRNLIAEDTTTNTHGSDVSSATVANGTGYHVSLHYKAGTRTNGQLRGSAALFSGAGFVDFNLSTGATNTSGGTVANITSTTLANGWFRLSATFTATGSGSATVLSPTLINTSTAVRAVSYTGVASNNFSVYGGQCETGTKPTSYIPTAGSTVTRPADALVIALPAGTHTLTYTFDDNSTQVVTGLTGNYSVPTTLNRFYIKTISGARTA